MDMGHVTVVTYSTFIRWKLNKNELGLNLWFLNSTIKNQKLSSIRNIRVLDLYMNTDFLRNLPTIFSIFNIRSISPP